MTHHWTIAASHAGQRLDLFILEHFPARSRSAIQKQIQSHAVVVNDAPATVHRFLKVGDTVAWSDTSKEKPAKTKKKTTTLANEPRTDEPAWKLAIVAETPDWLVIDKPAGLLVHPDTKTAHGTLIDLLIKHDPKIAKIGADPERPGIVHRLDREVSGLMVVAKTQEAYDRLQDQFAQRKIKKTYLALVHGVVSHDEGDIKLSLSRSTSKARMAAHPPARKGKESDPVGKAAWTHYRVIERFIGATLVELQILSGRTHQIRAHMHAIGHPVIGDPLYIIRRTDRKVVSPRILLQSIALTFTDPRTGEPQSFALDPDLAFATFVDEFRKS